MMKTLTLRNALLLSFMAATLFTACSKDAADITEKSVNKTTDEMAMDSRPHFVQDDPNDDNDLTFGSLKLTVTPADELSGVIIFNDNFSAEIYPTDGTGIVQFDNVPVGSYTVIVIPSDDNYRKSAITDAQVADGALTDLGTVTLEN